MGKSDFGRAQFFSIYGTSAQSQTLYKR